MGYSVIPHMRELGVNSMQLFVSRGYGGESEGINNGHVEVNGEVD